MAVKVFDGITRKVGRSFILYSIRQDKALFVCFYKIFARVTIVHSTGFSIFSVFWLSHVYHYSLQVVPVFIALSFIGWIVFVAGFGKLNKEYALLYTMHIYYGITM